MKNLKWLIPLTLAGILLSASCKKDRLNQLPPATQEGRRTFGCLVNGKPFVHKYQVVNFGPPTLQSYYQHLNTPTAQGYFFNVSASRNNDSNIESISIGTENLPIQEGKTYILKDFGAQGEAFASYAIAMSGSINEYVTIDGHKGELHITKLDEAKQIVSGTFWFDAVNDKGEKVEVREGRFDMVYTK